jgi:predicted AlkP superfamily pyrophosphatase or phosphodiesterase
MTRSRFQGAALICVSVSVALAIAVVTPLRARLVEPRLIVLLVVDQMRADYADSFGRQWTTGLHRLMTEGAWFRQVDYPYFDTVTCPGHATISTGSLPSTHGMVMNTWWDRRRNAEVRCTQDDSTTLVSYGKPVAGVGDSAANFRTTTLSDELRSQLSPRGRVIAFSLKARSAITLGGHHPDAVTWFDDSGSWVTSSAFAGAPVPEVADFIRRHPVQKDFEKIWDRVLPKPAYLYEASAIGARSLIHTATFPHSLSGAAASPDKAFYDRWQTSPYSDQYMAEMALDVAEHMHFEKGDGTNMIAIGFSALDRVGHDFGPNSHEVQDVLIRLDRTLGTLFSGLDRLVGPGNYTVALTADHGVAPIPEGAVAAGLDAGRIVPSALAAAVDDAFRRALGPGQYVARLVDGDVYLRPGVFERWIADRQAVALVRDALRGIEGVADVYTRDRIARHEFDDDDLGRRLAYSYDRERSGDLTIVLKPYWIAYAGATTHGTAYGYDTRVPMFLMGRGIMPGQYRASASPMDLAPTLASLAGVRLPRAQGRLLSEALIVTDASHQSSAAPAPAPESTRR